MINVPASSDETDKTGSDHCGDLVLVSSEASDLL